MRREYLVSRARKARDSVVALLNLIDGDDARNRHGIAVSACELAPFVRLEQALQQEIAPLRRLGVKAAESSCRESMNAKCTGEG
jgi:hypothetical protein